MSFKKIVTYSTALTLSYTMSLFVDAQINQASAASDQCLTSLNEVTMTLNKGTKAGIENFFPKPTDVETRWVNAPYGDVMTFGHNANISESYMKKVSTKIINNCKGTVAVEFITCAGECQDIYGVAKGKVVKFKYPGCTRTNSTVNGAFNRYGKLNWGYTEEDPMC
jgi:hypothetical protein